ncbi:hypothetical protein HPB47_027162 [Ixodes persulcatus]|uniref:Uncharacterized protein n=1 Tax=Ixodes persulcatus TaxID=34615 RepID=A0AC60PX65_IXOPE|nr:hypothetical protein HPB47_027162 [Ixodes persulcatus]
MTAENIAVTPTARNNKSAVPASRSAIGWMYVPTLNAAAVGPVVNLTHRTNHTHASPSASTAPGIIPPRTRNARPAFDPPTTSVDPTTSRDHSKPAHHDRWKQIQDPPKQPITTHRDNLRLYHGRPPTRHLSGMNSLNKTFRVTTLEDAMDDPHVFKAEDPTTTPASRSRPNPGELVQA